MEGKTREETRQYYQNRMGKIMQMVNIDNDTQFHFLEEAVTHLLDHFTPPKKRPEFTRDHVLLIGASFLGMDKENEDLRWNPSVYYRHGNDFELSKTLADMMRQDKTFAHVIFHAVQEFALGSPSKNFIDL